MITTSMGDYKTGPFILSCSYCMWSTLDVGIRFDKGTGIRGQLDEIANGGQPRQPLSKVVSVGQEDVGRKSSLSQPPFSPNDHEAESPSTDKVPPKAPSDHTSRFNALRQFYKDQIAESSATDGTLSTSALDMAYSSPSSLQRIMNIYTNRDGALKKARQKPTLMREALTASEGLQLAESFETDLDYDETTTPSQKQFQHPSFIGNPTATTTADLRPMPTIMRTKRSKRCAACKHILTRPEMKISSARYRIKLIALSYIPFVTIKPLPVPGGPTAAGSDGSDMVLPPGKPTQFIMTLRNPLFDNVNVSLGSQSITPGKHGHKVTILCPEFKIGKNSDAWDDALNNPPNKGTANQAGGEQVAGKLYDQGRNWASVVLEIVPASIVRQQTELLDEDEDVIEIPIRVRLQWQVTDEEAGVERRRRDKGLDDVEDVDDGNRELSYWMVVGIGRVAC
jgi:dynactin-4